MKRIVTIFACSLLAMAGIVRAQTTTLSVVVGPEASLTVTTGTTSLTTSGTNFSVPFSGTSSLTYQIRTTKTTGSGTITSKVTTDFGAGGPSVTTPPSAGDVLNYTCSATGPASACTGTQTASTAATTPVASFGPGISSSKAGNTASVAWALTDDPVYGTGTYTATVTFAISVV